MKEKKRTSPPLTVDLSDKINRNFSEAFKRSKVNDLAKKLVTISMLSRQLEVSRSAIYQWIHRYSDTPKGVRTVMQQDSEAFKTLALQQRLAELERIVGQKQLEIDYLNRAFAVASDELGYDLKKKYAPPPSNRSGSNPNPSS